MSVFRQYFEQTYSDTHITCVYNVQAIREVFKNLIHEKYTSVPLVYRKNNRMHFSAQPNRRYWVHAPLRIVVKSKVSERILQNVQRVYDTVFYKLTQMVKKWMRKYRKMTYVKDVHIFIPVKLRDQLRDRVHLFPYLKWNCERRRIPDSSFFYIGEWIMIYR